MTFWLSGCYAIIDDCIECENSMLTCYRAHRAWCEYNDDLDVDHRYHFRKGFLDGYKEAAMNGSSSYGHCQTEHCLPLMPPRCYWKHCYQNCEGRQKIDAWYQGYAHGAMVASQDGAYENYIIPTYGLNQGMNQPGAHHTTVLEEDLMHDGRDQLVPKPEEALPPNSREPVPAPDTYDGLPKLPPETEEPASEEPISGASYEYYEQDKQAEWWQEPHVTPASDQMSRENARPVEIDRNVPNARFTDVSTNESVSEHAQWETSAEFVLPVGYEGFRAPEWSKGANGE